MKKQKKGTLISYLEVRLHQLRNQAERIILSLLRSGIGPFPAQKCNRLREMGETVRVVGGVVF
jgi:hypothetical protein